MIKFNCDEWMELTQALSLREATLVERLLRSPDDIYWTACLRDTLTAKEKVKDLDLERK